MGSSINSCLWENMKVLRDFVDMYSNIKKWVCFFRRDVWCSFIFYLLLIILSILFFIYVEGLGSTGNTFRYVGF